MAFVLPTSIRLKAVERACDYYRRCQRFDGRREAIICGSVVFAGGLFTQFAASPAIGQAFQFRSVVAIAFLAVTGALMVVALRWQERRITSYNLTVAVSFCQAGRMDHAFLVLFDEPRLLSPSLLRESSVRQVIRDVLRSNVECTSVSEINTVSAVRGLLQEFAAEPVERNHVPDPTRSPVMPAASQPARRP